ncbi:concanavalin A-like lectin/glucanase domain-containing protein [Phycomyces blakesleeanus]
MKLLAPNEYIPKIDNSTGQFSLPYNLYEGTGPTFNPPNYMQYGKFTATIKAAPEGGAVTAIILIADNGDEIDYELIGADDQHAQTNYFWGQQPVVGVNGGIHDVSGSIYSQFHTYTINWTPEKIDWIIDGEKVRTKNMKDTCSGGVCKYPTHPARVQIGLWDGSRESGTAEWAHGPINWSKTKVISSYIKELTVECNPEYNTIS